MEIAPGANIGDIVGQEVDIPAYTCVVLFPIRLGSLALVFQVLLTGIRVFWDQAVTAGGMYY